MVLRPLQNSLNMFKDFAICTLASLNLLIFSFISLNAEAFAKIMTYERSGHKISLTFDESVMKIQNNLANIPNQQPVTSNQLTTFLLIPSINVIAPIQSSLERGVVAWNNVLFGHSSDYPWNSNPYGTIFTLLPKMKKGDHFTLLTGKEKLQYLVTGTSITDPQLTGLVSKNSDKNELILSTCYPIGFSNQRFNVKATLLHS